MRPRCHCLSDRLCCLVHRDVLTSCAFARAPPSLCSARASAHVRLPSGLRYSPVQKVFIKMPLQDKMLNPNSSYKRGFNQV